MKKSGKLKITFVAVLAAITAFAVGAIATPKPANAEETVRVHSEYSLHTIVGGAAESTLNDGVTQYMRNGYVNLTTSGGEVAGAHGFKVALESYDFTNFKTIWLNAKAISGNWGDLNSRPERARTRILSTRLRASTLRKSNTLPWISIRGRKT